MATTALGLGLLLQDYLRFYLKLGQVVYLTDLEQLIGDLPDLGNVDVVIYNRYGNDLDNLKTTLGSILDELPADATGEPPGSAQVMVRTSQYDKFLMW